MRDKNETKPTRLYNSLKRIAYIFLLIDKVNSTSDVTCILVKLAASITPLSNPVSDRIIPRPTPI
ncbi:hypothetical protein SOASR029_06230 [Budvicia aquatica]|nr:hypothetical protein SOASR029_06230 [Budvicia aquatica]